MKYPTLLLVLLLSIGAHGQQLDHQYLISIQRPTQNNFSSGIYTTGPNFNFTFIQSYKPNKAWRVGLGIYSDEIDRISKDEYIVDDTIFRPIERAVLNTPFIFIGHESRKYLHKDVFIMAGMDIGLGAGSTRMDLYTHKKSKVTDQAYGTYIEKNVSAGRFSLYSFARPQIGARVAWGAFIAGYSLGMPLDFKTNFNVLNININFRHEFAIGLRFNQKKEKKRNFLMIKY